MAKRRRWKSVVGVLVGLVVLLALLVALGPTLAGLGPGRGIVANAITERVNGTAEVRELGLSWFGRQSIGGLRIVETGGREAVNLDVTIDAGLLSLLTGSSAPLPVTIAGAMAGEVREDGSTSFGDLARTPDAAVPSRPGGPGGPGEPRGADQADEPFSLAGIPAAEVEITGLEITLDAAGAGDPLRIDDLNGHARYVPGEPLTLALASPTTAGDLRGSVQIDLTATGLADGTGALTPAGAQVNATVELQSIPVPFATQVQRLELLVLTARADDLTKQLDVTIQADTLLEGAETSRLGGELAFREPVDTHGRLNIGLDTIVGDLTGNRVPTTLLQPALAGTPLLLARDLGPFVDLRARFGPGAADDPATGTVIAIAVDADAATLELDARVTSDGAVAGSLAANAVVQPALAEAVAARPVLAAPTRVGLTVASFALPAPAADGTRAIAAMPFDGEITFAEPVRLLVPGDETGVTIRDATLAARTDGLASGVRLQGTAAIDDGQLTLDETVTGLVDTRGQLDAAGVIPVGRIALEGLDGARVATLAVAVLGEETATPVVRAIADDLLRGPTSVVVTTSATEAGLGARMEVSTDRARVAADVVREPAALAVDAGTVEVQVTPALVRALQATGEEGLTLAAPVSATVTVRPFRMAGGGDEPYTLPATPVLADFELGETRVQHPALAEPVVVDASRLVVGATLEEGAYSAAGRIRLVRGTNGKRLGVLRCDLTARAGEDDTVVPGGRLDLENLSVRDLEAVLGHVPGTAADWVGDSGGVTITIAEESLEVQTALERLTGELRATIGYDELTISTTGVRLNLASAAAERILNPPVETEDGRPAAPTMRVAADVPLEVAIDELRTPLALVRGEPFDTGAVRIKLTATGGPLRLVDTRDAASSIESLAVTLDTDDLATGVGLGVNGRVAGGGTAAPGVVKIEGRLNQLVSETSTLDTSRATLDMTADVDRVPTAVADSLLALEHRLVAAVGPTMDAEFVATGFSRRSGRLEGRLESANGYIDGLVLGRERELRTSDERPFSGELAVTPALRRELLEPLHPIFADVRTVEQPIRFTTTKPARLPTDGDTSQLRADLEITVGAVEFTASSPMLALLVLFDNTPQQTIPGRVEPIIVKIRNGIVTYDRFTIAVSNYTMVYQGQVDLVQRVVDLRTEIPLDALAGSFRELQGYADKIVVPLVTRGPFGDVKTEIDPDFDIAGAAAEAGFRGALGRVLEEQTGDATGGGLLGNLGGLLGGQGGDEEEPDEADEKKKKKKKKKKKDR